MALTANQISHVCLMWQGAKQCRYLSQDDSTGDCLCVKLVKQKREVVDRQVVKFVQQARAAGQDPAQMGRPIGDNCKGYRPLKTIPCGYDVP